MFCITSVSFFFNLRSDPVFLCQAEAGFAFSVIIPSRGTVILHCCIMQTLCSLHFHPVIPRYYGFFMYIMKKGKCPTANNRSNQLHALRR